MLSYLFEYNIFFEEKFFRSEYASPEVPKSLNTRACALIMADAADSSGYLCLACYIVF